MQSSSNLRAEILPELMLGFGGFKNCEFCGTYFRDWIIYYELHDLFSR